LGGGKVTRHRVTMPPAYVPVVEFCSAAARGLVGMRTSIFVSPGRDAGRGVGPISLAVWGRP
jgi:hypothetical protein